MKRELRKPRQRRRADVYNPLTGNRMFHVNLRDGRVPAEERTVEPPVYEGPGQRFVPADRAPGGKEGKRA